MKLKDKLIREVSENTEIPEDIVSKIIGFQGEDALKYVKQVHELEFSGFGKFLLSQTKLKRKLASFERILAYFRAKEDTTPEKIEEILSAYEKFKTKLK